MENAALLPELSTKEGIAKAQKHPNAAKNFALSMEQPSCFAKFCGVLIRLPVILLIALPLLVAIVVIAIVVTPLYCLCQGCMLNLVGLEEVDQHDPNFLLPNPPEGPPGFPQKLTGIGYMRLNPLSDDLFILSKGTWDANTNTLWMKTTAPGGITFHKKLFMFILLIGLKLLNVTYEMVWEKDLTEGRIYMRLCCCRVPSFLVDFRMADVSQEQDGSLFERYSWMLGIPTSSYWFERIVTARSMRTPYFDGFVRETPQMVWIYK